MEALFFSLASLALFLISITSLRRPGSHGFYRFFAWETILGMFVLNLPGWFANPFAWHQVILLVAPGIKSHSSCSRRHHASLSRKTY